MALYWPMAMTKDGEKLFTQDAATSAEECYKQFDIWQNHYHYDIKEAWFDKHTKDGGIRYHCSRVWKVMGISDLAKSS